MSARKKSSVPVALWLQQPKRILNYTMLNIVMLKNQRYDYGKES